MSTSERRTPFYQTVDGVTIPGSFDKEIFLSGLDYKPNPEDLFIASYPKCGTTWTQMIVFLINNKGIPAQDATEFFRTMPFLELYGMDGLRDVKLLYSIKVHLPFDKTPYSPETKYIYVTRNPKDAVVSFFHHSRTTVYMFEEGEFDVYFDLFMEGKVDFGDYFDHVLSWYEHRHDKNVLFITYEELKADTRAMVLKIAHFMGEEYDRMLKEDPQILENVLKYSSLDEMKKILNKHMDETVGDMSVTAEDIDAMPIPLGLKHIRKFVIQHRKSDSVPLCLIRKGQVGGYRNTLTDEQRDRMDKRIKEKLIGTELYELWKNL